jgi:hypothetical protein
MAFSTLQFARAAARVRAVTAEVLVFLWGAVVLSFVLLIIVLYFR